MQVKMLLFICSGVLVMCCECLNILAVYEIILPSHFKTFENLFEALAVRGHNVTVISFFTREKRIENYTELSLLSENGLPRLRIVSIEKIKSPKLEMYSTAHLVAEMAEKSCKALLTNPGIYRFLAHQNSFDVILREIFHSNCDHGIAKKFKAPVVGKKVN